MVISPYQKGGWEFTIEVWSKWQTFNAGMIALLAATITARTTVYIHEKSTANKIKQLKHELRQREQDRKEAAKEKRLDREREDTLQENKRKRELMLAKPFLTHSLSALLGAIEEYQDILLGIYVQYQKDPSLVPSHLKAVASKFENVDIDKGYERAIRECALLEEDDTASYFANYVAELQVFFSRMEGLKDPKDHTNQRYTTQMLAYSTSVQLKTVGMFEYGRSESAIQEYHLDEQHYYNKLIGKRASIEDDLKEAIRIYTKKETTS